MIQRIAVMGAGSLGTILGAYLSKAGRDVVLIDAYQAHVDALNQNGAHITGAVEMTVPVKAITPEQMEGQYDLFFYLAKQTYQVASDPTFQDRLFEVTKLQSLAYTGEEIKAIFEQVYDEAAEIYGPID